jgi:protein-L-isoaspartate(D-aspartate) O-methyltransferase
MNAGINLRGIGMTSQRTRERMVQRLIDEGIASGDVLQAMRNTPRHIFVDEALASRAYENVSLPISHGQTISQPYVVARMTEALLTAGPLHKVLEVGTGSGYQTAVLAQLAKEVHTVERIRALQTLARTRLASLHLNNVRYKYSDGSWGWPENAPYDGILVTAAPMEAPLSLLEQLAIGGRMVIPIGGNNEQQLYLYVRTRDGFEREMLHRVKFVAFRGGRE